MPAANIIELETCLQDSLAYTQARMDDEIGVIFHPRLAYAEQSFSESKSLVDSHYLTWRVAVRDEVIAWKKVAGAYREVQLELTRLEATGFDNTEVLYWDHEILESAVRKVTDYLDNVRANTDEDASLNALRGDLDRCLEAAKGWAHTVSHAIETYRRQVTFRSQAFATVTSALTEFRQSLRSRLGKQNPDYQAIRWPMCLAPDEPVL